jgi:carboxyl-terminal processing protease
MKTFLTIIAAVAIFAGTGAFAAVPITPKDELSPRAEHKRATRLITHFIANYHYQRPPLDDALSAKILERYVEMLDSTKSYLLQSDVDEFHVHSAMLDDYLRQSNLQPVYDMYVRYRERVEERIKRTIATLDESFDFSREETFMFDREDAAWAASPQELDELWRKRVKNDILSLSIAGKEHDEITDTLRKRYEGILRRTGQLNSEDVFQMFINAYTTSIDPHTAYFSPRTSENFKIRMSLSLEGIGAVLQTENEHTLVREVVPGGPADKGGKLHAEDRIIGIGQGAEGDIVDVVGWRLDDVVDLIRGKKGTIVKLEILPKKSGLDGPGKVISIERNTIQLEEQAAKSSVLEAGDAARAIRVAVIELPTFYMDFDARSRGDENYRSTTRDVRRLIGELETDSFDALIIDLRGNGGGSLSEATDLTGLFIDTGPVVQVRNSQGRVQLERDTDRGVAYSGPLAVLVDRNSASASEIFAGAIQDYRRGIVLGEPTFGKGTVQNLVDLNRFDDTMDGKLGQLKATIAQFFRVAGGSTQHKGVIPDIVFPTALSADDHGERALNNALPWAKIAAARFKPVDDAAVSIDMLREQHLSRVAKDPAFQALLAQEAAIEEARERTEVSLVRETRKAEHDKNKREQRERENQIRVAHGLAPLPEDDDEEEADDTLAADDDDNESAQRDDEEQFDIILEEASHVVADMLRPANAPASRLVDTTPKDSLLSNRPKTAVEARVD